MPADDLAGIGGTVLTEAITRLRRGEAIKDAGYDGEYGRIRLFRPGELGHSGPLFDVPPSPPRTAGGPADRPRPVLAVSGHDRSSVAQPAATPERPQPDRQLRLL